MDNPSGKARRASTMTHNPDRNGKGGRAFLESIVARSVDPDAIAGILQQFSIETTLGAPDLASSTRFSSVRIREVKGIQYILCPVPPFYDEERHIETGFAIDVDQDHFDVYPYMFDTSTRECIILTKLPHCVVRAIKMDAITYDVIDDGLKEIANESSAILFISNLYTELLAGRDSPIEFFDNRLFQQLLGKVLSVKDGKWMNISLVHVRFDQLVHQLDGLDEASPFHAENKKRVLLSLAHFLVETDRIMDIDELLKHVDKNVLFSIIDPIFQTLINNYDLAIAMELVHGIQKIADVSLMRKIFARLVARGEYDHAMALERSAGLGFGKDEAVIQETFTLALHEGLIHRLRDIESFFGVKFAERYAVYSVVQRACNDLVEHGQVGDAIELARISGVSYHPEDPAVLHAYSRFVSEGKVDDAVLLDQWTGIQYHADEAQVRDSIFSLLGDGRVKDAKKLVSWTGITPSLDGILVRNLYGKLLKDGKIDEAMELETWTKISYNPVEPDVQLAYSGHLRDKDSFQARLDGLKRLEAWTGIKPSIPVVSQAYRSIFSKLAIKTHPIDAAKLLAGWIRSMPPEDLVQDLYAIILQATRNDERFLEEARALRAWTGINPKDDLISAEYKHYLKGRGGAPKGFNAAIIQRLIEWTGIIPPGSLVQEAFDKLLSAPLHGTGLDDAAIISLATGMKPQDQLIQETYHH
nr:hypothetical protein [Candidatus Sigynarchaeota archaeon]